MASNESFFLAGPAGRLEAVLMRPLAPPVAAAVVCHAHPLHGGMMHLKVVFRAAKALQSAGLAVLRFNFRGVGRSEGERDQFGPAETIRALVAPLPGPRELVVIPGSDHFFGGQLDALQAAVAGWAARRPWDTP